MAMFPVDKAWNIFHGSGPVEGIHGNEILKAVGLQILQVFFHARGLELEKPGRLSP